MPISNPRSIASLTISFGLVAIPVKLYSATVSSERISFNLLRQKDGSRVRQQYVAVSDGKLVERSEMTKGYEFAKDLVCDVLAKSSRALKMKRLIHPYHRIGPGSSPSTRFISTAPTTLLPTRAGRRSPSATALKKAKQCAVGRWTSRGKEHIIVSRPIDNGLAMHQLHFKAEVRSIKDLGVESAPASDAELEACQSADRTIGQQALRPQRIRRRTQSQGRGRNPAQGGRQGDFAVREPCQSRQRQRDRLDGSTQGESARSRVEGGGH